MTTERAVGARFLTSEPIRVACTHDPAIVPVDEKALMRYMVSRDERFITAEAGSQIQWYVCAPLRRSDALEITAMAVTKEQAQVAAFQRAVTRVENLHTDATIRPVFTPAAFSAGGTATEGWNKDELDHIPPDDVFDIGDVILRRANFRRGMQPWFPPLDSSVRALGELAFQGAVESLEAASRKRAEAVGP